jgi:hypothetical protein
VKLFRRSDSADDVLVAVAAEQRWQSAPSLGALSMLPPSHAAADIHGLNGRLPPGCGGRAFTGFVAPGVPMTVSHVEVYRTDVDHEIYDVVQCELVNRRAAVFTWSAVAHRSAERWAALLSAASAFSRLVDRTRTS